jgi:predicted alpha-1,2-mannosidase
MLEAPQMPRACPTAHLLSAHLLSYLPLPLLFGCTAPHGQILAETATDPTTGLDTTATTDLETTSTGPTEPFEWPAEQLTQHVDPFIGTGGQGYRVGTINPGATRPFGMVKPGPDTGLAQLQLSFLNCTGYHYDQTHIWGFSHSRINGMGVPDYGAVLVTPTTGVDPSKAERAGARALFTHDQESAEPGYYAVRLQDPGVQAELTATDHVALHRYTWDAEDADAAVLFDLGYNPGGNASPAGSLVIDPQAQTISGFMTVHGGYSDRFGGVPTYFVARASRPFVGYGVWADDKLLTPSKTAAEGAQIGAWLQFELAPGDTAVELALAISYVSVEQAAANLAAEAPTFEFDAVRAEAAEAWQRELARIRVLGGSAEQRTIFYSALYHTMLAPTLFSEVGGWYRGFDGAVHQTDPAAHYYTDFSLWDTYRTLHPLFNLIQRQRHGDMMRSLVTMYQQGGDLPKWPLAFGYTGGMVGTPADIVLADAFLKGIMGFDPQIAYEGARLHATEPRPNDGRAGIEGYLSRGWVASDEVSSAAARTLEFAHADAALSRFAAALSKDADAALFAERAKNYKNLWDPQHQFLIGRRADGSFESEGFDPLTWQKYYAEGTAWHYLWMVPHDLDGLAELHGGRPALRQRLAAYFEQSQQFLEGPDFTPLEPVPYYWHSNEPSLHNAHIFTATGDPAASQRWVAWARERHYGRGPDGLPGNDDAGTMSAWYIWSAIGLYPLPGADVFWISAPIFDRIELDLSDPAAPDRRLTILTEGATKPGMIYIAEAQWNGAPLDRPWLTWEQLDGGGALLLKLTDAPTLWGADPR